MKLFKKSLIDTYKIIKKNKLLFTSLVIIKLIFVILLLVVGIGYQIKIYQSAQAVMQPLQQANYNVSSLQAGSPFLPNMMKQMVTISKNYQTMVNNIFSMLGLMLLVFLVINGFVWSSVHYMVKKGNFLKRWLKFNLVTLVFLIPVSLISYFILYNLVGNMDIFEIGLKIVLTLILVMSYFIFVGFCLIDKKKLFKKIFVMGITKAPRILMGIIMALALIFLSSLFIYYSTGYLSLMIISALVLMIIFIFNDIYMINLIKNLE